MKLLSFLRRSTAAFFILLFSTCFLFFAPPASAQEGDEVLLYSQDFESGNPDDWEFEPGWEIVEMDGGHVLKGESHHFAWPLTDSWQDYRLRFRVKFENDAALHANIRSQMPVRYFIGIGINHLSLSKQLSGDIFKDGLVQQGGIGAGWHDVEISAYGDLLSLSLDGVERFEYKDPEPLMAGGFSFESLTDARVWLDDVEIWGPAPKPTPTVPPEHTWIRLGGPIGGLGYDIRMHPDNPDMMFVTDAMAGVFISQDGGQTWAATNQGISARSGETGDLIPVFSLTIDPVNPQIVWIGIQNQKGIYKSEDKGQTWTRKVTGITEQNPTFRGFGVDWRDSNIVYAAAEIGSWEYFGESRPGREFDRVGGVVYKTTDGGENWVQVWRGDNLARYVLIDPRNPDTIYVSTGIFDREAANSNPQTGEPGGVGILKSTDAGKTWQALDQKNGLNNLYVGSLFMHPQNPDILIAGTGNVQYNEGRGVYISEDGGESWTHTLKDQMISSVEFAASDPKIAYAGGYSAMYRSNDGGYSWKKLPLIGGSEGWGPVGTQAGHPIDFQVDPLDPDRIFVNNYGGGNFLSTDGGQTWAIASKGYTGAQVRDLAVNPAEPAQVIAAARSGIFTSYNGGEDWTGLASPPFYQLDWHSVAVNPADGNTILSELTCPRVLVRSTDGGQSWQQVDQAPMKMAWKDIVFAPSDPQIAYAGIAGWYSCGSFDEQQPGGGVYRSEDGGKTWQPANDTNTSDAAIAKLAVDAGDPQVVYAASFNKGLLKSSDGGNNWVSLEEGLPQSKQLASIALHPRDANILFAGSLNEGLYSSSDAGQSWQHVSAGLNPEGKIREILIDQNDPSRMYLADNRSGVYLSEDKGITWMQLPAGMNNKAVDALALSHDSLHLYAATEGDGVYRMDLNGLPPQPVIIQPSPTPPPTSTAVPPRPTAIPTVPATEAPAGKSAGGCPSSFLPLALVLGLRIYFQKTNSSDQNEGKEFNSRKGKV